MSLDEFLLLKDELFEAETAVSSNPVPAQTEPPLRNNTNSRDFFSWEIDDSVHFYDSTGEGNYLPLSNWSPESEEAWRALSAIKQGNVFFLELIHKVRNEVLSIGFFVYQSTCAVAENNLSLMVQEMISGLPKIAEVDNDRWLFFEASAMWVPRIYSNEGSSANLNNYGFRLSVEVHFLDFMSVGAGAQINQDLITVSGTNEEYRDLLLEVPLSLKLVFKPTNYFRLEPYGGISYNYSLLGITSPSSMSWFAGLQFGIKVGFGMLVIDPRYSSDFENSSLSGVDIGYQRNCIYLGVGYKIGLIPKSPRRLEY
jgi:hypothetical protein